MEDYTHERKLNWRCSILLASNLRTNFSLDEFWIHGIFIRLLWPGVHLHFLVFIFFVILIKSSFCSETELTIISVLSKNNGKWYKKFLVRKIAPSFLFSLSKDKTYIYRPLSCLRTSRPTMFCAIIAAPKELGHHVEYVQTFPHHHVQFYGQT